MFATERRVTAVRTNRWLGSSWESITHLKAGGVWYTKQEVIDHIRYDLYRYFTCEDGTTAYLIVEYPGGLAPPYVRTRPDCSYLNNLLSLPRE